MRRPGAVGLMGERGSGLLVLRGDALRLPLADASVDLVVTSPPYFALRAYGSGHAREVGAEVDPAAYLRALWQATREMARVLKPAGSIWVNLGDTYATSPRGPDGSSSTLTNGAQQRPGRRPTGGLARKSLMGLPWAYALGCTGMLARLGSPDPDPPLGLILRAEVIWSKPNGLPESVTDRVRRTHETWFHLVKSPRYYAAVDELREPHSPASQARAGRNRFTPDRSQQGVGAPNTVDPQQACHPAGRLPASVWTIPAEPLRLPAHLGMEHYAAFGAEWPRRLVRGWSPPGICVACGQGRFPVVDRCHDAQGRTTNGPRSLERRRLADGTAGFPVRAITAAAVVGYACACTPFTDHPERRGRSWQPHDDDAGRGARSTGHERPDRPREPIRNYHLDRWTPPPTRPAVVLDPFGGTGTTAHVAVALGRVGISVDLHPGYCRVAADPTVAAERAGKARARTNRDLQGMLL